MSLLQVKFDGTTVCALRPEHSTKTFGSADVPKGTESVIYKAAKLLVHSQNKSLTVGLPSFSSDDLASKVTTKKAALTAVAPGEVIYDSTNDMTGTISTYDETLDILDQTKVLKPTTAEIQAKIDSVRGFTDEEAELYTNNENYTLLCANLTSKASGTCTIDGVTLTDESSDFSGDGVVADDMVVVGNEFAIITAVDGTNATLSNSISAGDYNIYTPMTVAEAKSALRQKDSDGAEVADMTEAAAETALIDEAKEELATMQVNKIVAESLEVPSLSTTLESGTCTTSTSILTDGSADFVSAGVAEDDLVKVNGGLYKVDSVTSATVLELKAYPANITEATAYEVLNSPFMTQFDYVVGE